MESRHFNGFAALRKQIEHKSSHAINTQSEAMKGEHVIHVRWWNEPEILINGIVNLKAVFTHVGTIKVNLEHLAAVVDPFSFQLHDASSMRSLY